MSVDLLVIGLGGNAISPPRGALTFADERVVIASAASELSVLAREGARLLVVHGNGPQVGRLLLASAFGDPGSLDVHVAQTQGELGYLLTEALEARLGIPCAALVTRVVVAEDDSAFATPTKPIGGVFSAAPADVTSVRTPDGSGFRRVVASPRPVSVLEEAAIAELLTHHHVVAGGGGGIPLARRAGGRACATLHSAERCDHTGAARRLRKLHSGLHLGSHGSGCELTSREAHPRLAACKPRECTLLRTAEALKGVVYIRHEDQSSCIELH